MSTAEKSDESAEHYPRVIYKFGCVGEGGGRSRVIRAASVTGTGLTPSAQPEVVERHLFEGLPIPDSSGENLMVYPSPSSWVEQQNPLHSDRP